MSVTEPSDEAFFLLQHIEGHPDFHFRSTVWTSYRQHLQADKWVKKHMAEKEASGYCEPRQQYYLSGPHGLTQ